MLNRLIRQINRDEQTKTDALNILKTIKSARIIKMEYLKTWAVPYTMRYTWLVLNKVCPSPSGKDDKTTFPSDL
jgi:hypothetical protein